MDENWGFQILMFSCIIQVFKNDPQNGFFVKMSAYHFLWQMKQRFANTMLSCIVRHMPCPRLPARVQNDCFILLRNTKKCRGGQKSRLKNEGQLFYCNISNGLSLTEKIPIKKIPKLEWEDSVCQSLYFLGRFILHCTATMPAWLLWLLNSCIVPDIWLCWCMEKDILIWPPLM